MILILLLCLILFISNVLSRETLGAIFNADDWISIEEPIYNTIERPPQVLSNTYKDINTEIFVSIVEYRDSRCPLTLFNIFTKAANPNRIMIGLIKQVHTEEDSSDCVKAYCLLMKGNKCPYVNQIRNIEMSYLESRGPTNARHMSHFLLEDEEFCMQVDSHSDFVKDWDVAMSAMWGSIDNEYAILSTKPPDISTLNKNVNERYEVPHLCEASVNDNGMIRNLLPRAAMNLPTPILSPLWSSSFSFSKCHAERKIPSDPSIAYIAEGDEFSKFARLWTRGYDVYTPSRTLIVHDSRNKMLATAPKLTKDESIKIDTFGWITKGMSDGYKRITYETSLRRLYTLLGMPGGDKDVTSVSLLTSFGLGTKRSLDQLIAFTGIDTRSKQAFGFRCKQLYWVPFTPDTDPEVEEGDVWGGAAEILYKQGNDLPIVRDSKNEISFITYKMTSQTIADNKDNKINRITKDNKVNNNPLYNHANSVMEEEIILVEKLADSTKGELWWIFQSVDKSVETFIDYVDVTFGGDHGFRVIKLLLLILPVFILVIGVTVWLLLGGDKRITYKEI